MLKGEINVGDALIWEPDDPRAFALVKVVEFRPYPFGERGIVVEDGTGRRHLYEESRVREACVRDEAGS